MSEPIRVDDLVMVVKPSECGCAEGVGLIFTVSKVEYNGTFCWHCSMALPPSVAAFSVEHIGWARLTRLKRIDPSAQDTDTETTRELEVTQ